MVEHAHEAQGSVAPPSRRAPRYPTKLERRILAWWKALNDPILIMTHPSVTMQHQIMKFHGAPPRAPGKPSDGLPAIAVERQSRSLEKEKKVRAVQAAFDDLSKELKIVVIAKYCTDYFEIREERPAAGEASLSRSVFRERIKAAEHYIGARIGVKPWET